LGRTIKSKEANQASSSGSNLTAGFAWNKREKLKTVLSALVIIALLSTAYLLSSKENPGNAPISLMIGVSLGLLLERGRFCFFCIYREGIEEKNTTPFLAILVAIASGSIGYSIIFGQFLPDTSTDSLPPAAHIGPVSWPLIVAALAFGIGMSLSGACISGHLYRIGQGYLRAIPALIGVLFGFVIAFLTWNWLYLRAIADAPTIWLPHTFGYAGSLAITFLALTAIAVFAIKKGKNSEPIRSQPLAVLTPLNIYRKFIAERWSPITTGALVGVVGTFAYLRVEPLGVTRQLSTSARTLMENRNIGPDSILGLDRLAGCIAVVSETITNNGWLAIGIIGSSFAATLAGGRFKLSTLTIKNSSSALLGGILLGWGSMTALGCTIGVLLSGTQAFALSGWLFFLFSFLGTLLGVKAKLHKI
jgi:uncharacterized membrane protein YedE/YeeE